MDAGDGAPGVWLHRDAWGVIRDATLLALPREACGYLGGAFAATPDSRGVFVVWSAAESANESPNDARCHFLIPAVRVRQVALRMERESSRLVGFFHSHPGGGPTPSEEDVERAWPGQVHLITSAAAAGIVGVRAFEVDADDGTPRELPVTVVDGRSSSLRAVSLSSSQVEACRA